MPGFCNCGFIPRPSIGTQSRRVYGLALKQMVAMKNTRIAPMVPVAYGANSRLSRLVYVATAPYTERINAQNNIDPACPLQKDVNTYRFGMFALICPATYSN